MNDLLIYSNLIAGVFLIFAALMLSTKNAQSALFFKVIPFFLGLVLLFNGVKLLGFI